MPPAGIVSTIVESRSGAEKKVLDDKPMSDAIPISFDLRSV